MDDKEPNSIFIEKPWRPFLSFFAHNNFLCEGKIFLVVCYMLTKQLV